MLRLLKLLEEQPSESDFGQFSKMTKTDFSAFDKNLYGLTLRLDLLSYVRYKKSFDLLFIQDRAKALEVLREVAGGQESFKTLLEYMNAITKKAKS
ncbi:MAG: hypothetical protein QXK14_02190 [Acidilobaceae archaeon]